MIVDDEPIAIRVVKNHLQNFVNIEIAGECANAIEAIEFLGQHQVDLIFLDIQMPQLSGIELIRSLQHPPMIIFTTAYRDFAVDAFDLDVAPKNESVICNYSGLILSFIIPSSSTTASSMAG